MSGDEIGEVVRIWFGQGLRIHNKEFRFYFKARKPLEGFNSSRCPETKRKARVNSSQETT